MDPVLELSEAVSLEVIVERSVFEFLKPLLLLKLRNHRVFLFKINIYAFNFTQLHTQNYMDNFKVNKRYLMQLFIYSFLLIIKAEFLVPWRHKIFQTVLHPEAFLGEGAHFNVSFFGL